ncbi:MAG: hypothetical protein H0U75_06510 [Legionella sp.]|nr:hypothetical protein [Legionella sp.]
MGAYRIKYETLIDSATVNDLADLYLIINPGNNVSGSLDNNTRYALQQLAEHNHTKIVRPYLLKRIVPLLRGWPYGSEVEIDGTDVTALRNLATTKLAALTATSQLAVDEIQTHIATLVLPLPALPAPGATPGDKRTAIAQFGINPARVNDLTIEHIDTVIAAIEAKRNTLTTNENRLSLQASNSLLIALAKFNNSNLTVLDTFERVPRNTRIARLQALGNLFPNRTNIAKLTDRDIANTEEKILHKRLSLRRTEEIKPLITAFDASKLVALNEYMDLVVTKNRLRGRPPADPEGILEVINEKFLDFNIPIDPQALLLEEAITINNILTKRHASLKGAQVITRSVTELSTNGNKARNKIILEVLEHIANTTTENDIRKALHKGKASLGGISVIDESQLSNNDANTIKTIATQQYNFLLIKESIKLIKQPRHLERLIHAADNLAAISEALNAKPKFGNRPLNGTTSLTLEQAQELKAAGILKHTQISAAPNYANVIVQSQGQLSEFKDTVVRHNQAEPPLPAPDPTAAALRSTSPLSVHWKGEKLVDGDVIHARAVFPPKMRDKGPGVAQDVESAVVVLVQDHTGSVIDKTAAEEAKKLTPEEKTLTALKQARMYLVNLKGIQAHTVHIENCTPEQANKLYAALLLLKGERKLSIVSHVVRCDAPIATRWQRQSSVEEEFIRSNLEANVTSSTLESLKKETHAFIKNQMQTYRNGEPKLQVDEGLNQGGMKI